MNKINSGGSAQQDFLSITLSIFLQRTSSDIKPVDDGNISTVFFYSFLCQICTQVYAGIKYIFMDV